ncbi:macrocin-O-methyltransferase [Candidatus Kaiserbacteria bacterium]|nr:macrocin-O-methyltransferase [Candidatus Kaiserbacteria bacterium]
MSELIRKIGISSHPAARMAAKILRFPILTALWNLLTFHKGKDAVKLIRDIQRENGFMMWPDEMMMLYLTARAMKGKKGDFAELGVSTGGSAKLLSEIKGDKTLHLFDTFEGLPDTDAIDTHLSRGQYACSLPAVKEYLQSYKNISYYQGLFPGSATAAEQFSFSLVHLDVDLYQSTLDGIAFFYPRMEKGGVIISHDYSTVHVVRRAFDEYFKDKPDTVFELPTSQCMIVKS